MSDKILDQIFENKIIAIIRGVNSDRILDTVKALLDGGIKLLEVTFNQESEDTILDTLKSIELIKRKYGNRVCLGVGTVLTVEQVNKAVNAGAEYMISPNTDVEVIAKTKELGKISIPGATSASEMVIAYNAGADIIKLFPAGILGVDYIKSLLSPLNYIPITAVGGINLDNVDQFIKAGAKGVGIGGNLVDKKAIYAGQYDKITKAAKAYVEKIESVSLALSHA